MFQDASLTFNSAFNTPQVITATANSAGVVDITGAGSGNAPAMIGAGGVNTAMGADIGQGDGIAIPYVVVTVPAAFATLTSLTIALQAAPDNGSYSPGTYTTIFQTEAIPVASLTAGAYFQFQVPPRAISGQPGEALPRFYRLVYTVGGSSATTGSVLASMNLNPPNGLVNTQYGSNFTAV